MATFDKDITENTAKPRGSGGGLQSKSLPDTAQPKGAGGGLQSKTGTPTSDAGAADAPQQPEDEHGPEASEQTTTPDSQQPA
jgi:hypothetical protein